MAVPLAIASIAGTAISAYGQFQAGSAQSRIAEQNAQIAEANARQSDLATADQLEQLATRTRLTIGKQKTGFAKAGVKREGTVLDVLTETANKADRDAYRISETGRFTREGFITQAAQERYRGKVAKQQSLIGAGSTLLTGFGQTGLAYRLGQSGGTPLTTRSV